MRVISFLLVFILLGCGQNAQNFARGGRNQPPPSAPAQPPGPVTTTPSSAANPRGGMKVAPSLAHANGASMGSSTRITADKYLATGANISGRFSLSRH